MAIRFGNKLTTRERKELEIGEEVLVVDIESKFSPFIGRVVVNTSRMKSYGDKIVTDVNVPEDFMPLHDDGIMIFRVD